MTQRYKIEMEMTRLVTVTVVAASAGEARALANNLDYQHEIQGELVRWQTVSISQIPDISSEVEVPRGCR